MKPPFGLTVQEKQMKRAAKKERNEIICADFKKLRREYPDENVSTLFNTLAYEYWKADKSHKGVPFPKTTNGVRYVVITNGDYSSKKRKKR